MRRARDRRAMSYRNQEVWHVYGLVDPRDGATRYIGSSFNPSARLSVHLSAPASNIRDWLDALRAVDLIPAVQILASFHDRDAARAHEGFLIAALQKHGDAILNRRSVGRHARVANSHKALGNTTPGRDQLEAWMLLRGMSQMVLAELIGVNQSSISLWLQGRARPEPHHRLLLAEVAGILQVAWMTGQERAALAEARNRFRVSLKGAA